MDIFTELQQRDALALSVRDADTFTDSGPQTGTIRHGLQGASPLLAYVDPRFAHPYSSLYARTRPLFAQLPPSQSVDDVLSATLLCAFIGAGASSTFLRVLTHEEASLVLFEPRRAVLTEFLERLAKTHGEALFRAVGEGRFLAVGGSPEHLDKPLSTLLKPTLFDAGFPAVYLREDLRAEERNKGDAAAPGYAHQVALAVELGCYRHRIYPVEAHAMQRGLPFRPLQKGLFHDQLVHAYENAPKALTSGRLRQLRNLFEDRVPSRENQGCDALLLAAGPELGARLDWIRKRRETGRVVTIAVNSALRPLVAAGLAPDFVVINDCGLPAATTFEGLPELPRTVLVAHSLAKAPDIFGARYFHGPFKPRIFGPRPVLRSHGSVLSTAYALARYLGCARAVLVGAQLASENPFGMAYAQGTVQQAQESSAAGQTAELPGHYPQLVPVPDATGKTLYTTPNFLDAAHWLRDEARQTGMPLVNTAQESILHGDSVVLDPDPAFHSCPDLAARMETALRPDLPTGADLAETAEAVREYLTEEREFWKVVRNDCAAVLRLGPAQTLHYGRLLLHRFDGNGVSFQVQRFEDFDNGRFHAEYFTSGDVARQRAALAGFLDAVSRMAETHFQALSSLLAAPPLPDHASDSQP